MSIEAISWALKLEMERSTEKFLLVCLANYANENGVCYPSQERLRRDTCQDLKTVKAGLSRLVEQGLLEDTGKRVGSTKSVIVYRLKHKVVRKSPSLEASPFFPEASPFFPEASPKTDYRTIREPSVEPKNEEPAKPAPSARCSNPRIKAVADRIFNRAPDRFKRISAWINDAKKQRYSDDVIVEALTRFDRYAPDVSGEWWPYADTILNKVEGEFNARDTQRRSDAHKRELREICNEAVN